MKKIVMMYVYYDDQNDIKSITPIRDGQFEGQGYFYTTFPVEDVEDFLTGKRNPFNFFIQHRRKNGLDMFKILPKQIAINYIRSVDNYLTEIYHQEEEPNAMYIENDIDNKCLIFYLDPILKRKEKDSDDDEELDKIMSFKGLTKINFYFTHKNDPSFLIKTVTIEPIRLFKEALIRIEYEEDLSNASLFTKKFFEYYSYLTKKEKDKVWHSDN